MATNKQEQAQELLTQLLALVGNGQGATPTVVAEATKAEVTPEVTPEDELVAKLGIRYAKGRTILTPDAIKAAARVLKNGKPEAIAKTEGFGSHVVLFRTDEGNVAVQNAFTPKEK